jgi:hypothetical protein
LVDRPFLFSVRDCQRLKSALGIERLPIGVDQIALQATDHHLTQLPLIGKNVTGEALIVQQLQQRGKRLGVSVVRCGRQEQPMLEVRANRTNETRALALEGVVGTSGGSDVRGGGNTVGFGRLKNRDFSRCAA